jgi:ClpP class serine protease
LLFSINICIVKGKETSGFRIASELFRSGWMIDEKYADNIFPYIQSILGGEPVAIAQGDEYENQFLGVEDGVAYLSIKDVIMSSDYCGSMGANSIASKLKELQDDSSVKGLVLILDTPGGSVTAGATITDALKAFTKNKISLVQGYAASAGYWIASNTDTILLSNAFNEVGSIGVYVTLYDSKGAEEKYGYKVINIYAPQSTEKNLESRAALEGNTKPMEEKLAKIADLFISDINASRPNINPLATKGKMYLAAEAIEMGLADEMGDMEKAKELAKEVKLYI